MIDEKIYQRQVTKQGLSDSLMDAKSSGSSFSLEELRDLFRCHEGVDCLTHDMLMCSCNNDGQNQIDCNDSSLDARNMSDEEDENEDSEVSWIRASQVTEKNIQKVSKQQSDDERGLIEQPVRQTNMKALRIYDHIAAGVANARAAEFDGIIEDEILQKVMQRTEPERGSISYLFVKKHGLAPPTPEPSVVGEGEGEVEDAASLAGSVEED